MKKIALVTLSVIGLVVLLVLTNPDDQSFHRHLQNRTVETSDNFLERVGNELGDEVREHKMVYTSYVVFSTVRIPRRSEPELYVGVLDQWLRVK